MSVDKRVLANIKFDANGLVPAIIQSAHSGRVLMMAWMNRESLDLTVDKNQTVFWSRSRQEIWHKGKTSGNIQQVVSIEVDCDSDVLLVKVNESGPACHTDAESCFDVQTLYISNAERDDSNQGDAND